MAEPFNHLEEVGRLAGLLLEGALGPADRRRLEEMLLADPAALEYYSDYVDVHCLLHWQHAQAESGEQVVDSGQGSETANQQSTIHNPQSFVPPIILDLSPAPHTPFFNLNSPVGGFLFSYTTAALMLGLALLVGWTWKIHYDRQLAEHSPPQGPGAEQPETPLVGRITGAVDCQWADPATEAFERDGVPLGRQYVLLSGFLEITYDSGTKVILQGPVTYAVESKQSGFLSRGKLTARVDKRAEGGGRRAEEEGGSTPWAAGSKSEIRNPKSEILTPPSTLRLLPFGQGSKGERTANLARSQQDREPTTSLAPRPSVRKSEIRNPKSEVSNPQSLIPNPLFFVRTPTAVVTDLGTEFGVEVDNSGATLSHVFRGKVEVRPAEAGNSSSPQESGTERKDLAVQLGVGESARVDVGGGIVKIGARRGRPRRFIGGGFHATNAPVEADQDVQHGHRVEGERSRPALAVGGPQRRPPFQAAGGRGDVRHTNIVLTQ